MSSFNPSMHLSSTDAKIVTALEKVAQVFRVLLWDGAKGFKVSPIQLQILVFIKYHPADRHRRIAFLAREFNMTKATVSDSIKTLEQKGLLARTPDKSDSRSYNFSLTSEGEALTESIEQFSRPLDHVIGSFPVEQKNQFFIMVLEIIYKLNAQGTLSVQRMCFNCRHYAGDRTSQHYCNAFSHSMTCCDLRLDCTEFLS